MPYNPVKVSADGCRDVDDFIKAIKKELQVPNPPQELFLSMTDGGPSLNPDDPIPGQNTAKTPLFVSVATAAAITRGPDSSFEPCQIPFFNDMPNVAEEDDWLVFSHAIPQSTQSCLYIRSSFKEIATDILRPPSGLPKAMITGTPGTGKSYFLIYLLWRLLEAKHRVLFIYHHMTIYYDGQGAIFRYPVGSFHLIYPFGRRICGAYSMPRGKNFRTLNALAMIYALLFCQLRQEGI